eukprot:GAFH01001558.1.p1 GENE.GAFH01001558.1~~GAFH01001558.1.p1  ORF type:complete len:437 (-),score=2.07 GAFH01001558.1:239-1411(-)
MKLVRRLCWPSDGTYRVGKSVIGVRPPLTTILRGCAESLKFLSIEFDGCRVDGWEWDPCLPSQFDKFPYLFSQLHTLVVRDGSSRCLIARCPRLAVLHLLNCPEANDFPHYLARRCPNLRFLHTNAVFSMSECLAEFCGLRNPPCQQMALLGGIGALLDDGEGDVHEPASSLKHPLPAATVRTLTLDCHPADLPSLVACCPRLFKLTVALRADVLVGHTALLRNIAATLEQCPHLRQLDLRLPSEGSAPALTLTPDELTALRLGPVLSGLSACMAFPDPQPVFPAHLRRCSLALKTVPPALTLDLPQVEELSLRYLATTPTLLRLRCPQLRSFDTMEEVAAPRRPRPLSSRGSRHTSHGSRRAHWCPSPRGTRSSGISCRWCWPLGSPST